MHNLFLLFLEIFLMIYFWLDAERIHLSWIH